MNANDVLELKEEYSELNRYVRYSQISIRRIKEINNEINNRDLVLLKFERFLDDLLKITDNEIERYDTLLKNTKCI